MSTSLPRSALVILDVLRNDGPLPPHAISSKTELPLRTVSFALRKLMHEQICRKIPNLLDMRKPLYAVDSDKARALFMKYGKTAM